MGKWVGGWRDPRNSPYEGEPDPLSFLCGDQGTQMNLLHYFSEQTLSMHTFSHPLKPNKYIYIYRAPDYDS